MTSRRFQWTVAVSLLLAVAYPLSLGPVCWWRARAIDAVSPDLDPRIGTTMVRRSIRTARFYRPLVQVLRRCPESIHESVTWYLGLGMPSDSELFVTLDLDAFEIWCAKLSQPPKDVHYYDIIVWPRHRGWDEP
jgi:hypothetical protein